MTSIFDQEITDQYAIYHGDACEVLEGVASESIHMSIYSPPFCGLFQYSSSERDLSNCRSYEEFFEHYEFVVRELYRVSLPGRITAVHAMDVPGDGANVGEDTIDFPGDIIRLHKEVGWRFACRYHVWKEPLGVRNRTMAKGLAHRQVVEDSTLCDNAAADQLLMFRKPGENPVPVAHPSGLASYAGARQVPGDLLRYRNWKGKQAENRYSHWIWRQYACHSPDTEVLTQAGWKLHQEVSLDDVVCCFNMQTNAQEWHYPSHIHAYPFRGDMVNINGGTKSPLDILVTPNHRMVVQPGYPLPVGSRKPYKNPRCWSFREAGTLSTSKWLVPYAVGEDTTGDGGDVAFARFLGWWISEGSLAYDAPVLTQSVGRTSERMRETVAELGYDANYLIQDDSGRQRQPCMHLRLRGAVDLGRWLREQCGDKTRQKHIPECAFSWSAESKQALLEALIDGDGTRHAENRSSYCTTSYRLADDVQRLAISLGHSGRIAKRENTKERHAPFTYYVHIGDRKYVTIQPRNFSAVPYSGMVYCLTVPTGAYVTRRNGRMAVTGNSAFWDDVRLDRILPYKESREPDDERHCLAFGSLVLTRAGYRPIESVEVGDEVLTHRGRWKPVLAKRMNGVREVVQVKAQGVPHLRLTPDHLLLCRSGIGPGRWPGFPGSAFHPRKWAAKNAPEWIQSSETRSHYLNLPLPPIEYSPLSESDWWVIGRWLGDGHLDGRGYPILSCSIKEVSTLTAALGRRAGHTRQVNRGTMSVAIKDSVSVSGVASGRRTTVFTEVLKKCGRGAAGKQLPPEAFALEPAKAEALLAGYLSADGHFVSRYQRWMGSSVSRGLLLGMALLAQRSRGVVASIFAGRSPNHKMIEGRECNTLQDWIFGIPPQNLSAMILDDGAWKKVRDIQPSGHEEVWDLEIEDDHSYVAEGCVVHNCHPLQLDVVERAVVLWSNPGEVVLSPFAGVGSELAGALMNGRRAIGVELKSTYFRQAVENLRAVAANLGPDGRSVSDGDQPLLPGFGASEDGEDAVVPAADRDGGD